MKNLNDDNLKLYFQKKKELLESALAQKAESEVKARVERELKELERMSDFEKKVRAARKEIEDKLLNTRCPHCGAAFIDWNACAALKCFSCRQSFCAYCQKKLTNKNSHSHVATCEAVVKDVPRGKSKLYPHLISPTFYIEAMAEIKKKRVSEYIASLQDAAVKEEVMRQCKQSLADLGIKFDAAAAGPAPVTRRNINSQQGRGNNKRKRYGRLTVGGGQRLGGGDGGGGGGGQQLEGGGGVRRVGRVRAAFKRGAEIAGGGLPWGFGYDDMDNGGAD